MLLIGHRQRVHYGEQLTDCSSPRDSNGCNALACPHQTLEALSKQHI